ncbi:unnamed protein product [Rhizophagus irregularis]|nr:unnamed protein product [Rhizophagus irregularis]
MTRIFSFINGIYVNTVGYEEIKWSVCIIFIISGLLFCRSKSINHFLFLFVKLLSETSDSVACYSNGCYNTIAHYTVVPNVINANLIAMVLVVIKWRILSFKSML